MKNKYITKRKVLIEGLDIGNVLFSKKIFIIILLFPFFKSSGFEAIPFLPQLANGMIFFECILFLGLVLVMGKTSSFLKIVLLVGVWGYLVAPIATGHPAPSLFYISGAIGVISFIELGCYYDAKKTFDAIGLLFTIMICLNFFTVVFFENGILNSMGSDSVYLFGLRTGFSLYIIPGILMNFLSDSIHKKKVFSLKTNVCFVAGVATLLIQWVATGIIELLIIVGLYVYCLALRRKKILNIIFWFAVIMIVNYIVTVLGTNSGIMLFLVTLLKRDITLTGRTEIWSRTIEKLSKYPLYGYGLDATVSINGVMKPTHNQWLHVALENGYIAMLLLICGVGISCIVLYKYKKTNIYIIITIGMIAILVACIAEIQTYIPFFYLIVELPFLMKYMEDGIDSTLPVPIRIALR